MENGNDNPTEQLYPYQSYEEQLFSEPGVTYQQNPYVNGYTNQENTMNNGYGYQNTIGNTYGYTQVDPYQGNPAYQGNPVNPVNPVNPANPGGANKPEKGKKKKSGAKIAIILVIAFLLAAGIAGGAVFYMYNRPEEKLERALESADKYYEAGKYHDALEEYKNALEIDNECIEAIVGGINCYEFLDDKEGYKDFYATSIDTVSGLASGKIEKNEEDIVDIYCAAASVYDDDLDTQLDVLTEGYEVTSENEEICDLIVSGYVEQAKEYYANDEVDEALDSYGDALSYDATSSDALDGLSLALDNEIAYLIENNSLDEAEEYIDAYEDSEYDLSNVDFEGYRALIEEKRAMAELIDSVMTQAMELLSSKDYDGMYELDGSDDADAVAETIDDYMIYTSDGEIDNSYTGTAVAIYVFDNSGYVFYYGGYENGIRTGTGTYFMKDASDGHYDLYEGEWANDMPNGEGTYSSMWQPYGNSTLDKVVTGNYTEGCENGNMSGTITYEGVTYSGTWTAENGSAPDISSSYSDLEFPAASSSDIVYAVYTASDSYEYYFYSYMSEMELLSLFAEFEFYK